MAPVDRRAHARSDVAAAGTGPDRPGEAPAVRVARTTAGYGRWALLGWAAALAAVVAVAATGARSAPEPEPGSESARSPVIAPSRVHADPGPLPALVRFTRPGATLEEITTPGLLVAGTAAEGVASVTVRLEGRAGRIIGRAIVQTAPSAGGGREFATTLALPNPRPNGTMWIRLEPTDLGPAAGIRIAVRIGRNLGPRPAVPGPWAPLGEDGFIGNVADR